jgi:nitrate/nitrite-specific signal transduction histidine kinase
MPADRREIGEEKPARERPKESRASGLLQGLDSAFTLSDLLRVVQITVEEATVRASGTDQRLSELERRLSEVETDGKTLSERLVHAENQSAKLMNLYVATYQLHSTLDPGEVQSNIAEIASNLLGAESFVLLLRDESTEQCDVVFMEGTDEEGLAPYASGLYAGGDPMVDAALADGGLRVGTTAGSKAIAVVPLTVQGATVGALVITRLLAHKADFASQDRELLELIAVHAASALFAAQVSAARDRKLHTLESLVKLARKE